jgi:hypothetical protein
VGPDAPGLDWNFDMYATAEESRASIVDAYRRSWAHADATIDALPLDAIGHVRHCPAERSEVTLHQMMVRVIADSQRHAGHADIIRELIDGAAGFTPDSGNLPGSGYSWQDTGTGWKPRPRPPRKASAKRLTGTGCDLAVRATPRRGRWPCQP